MPIRILPSDLSSQISAGEIIERPASVVKEIIENSIDAGSKNIDISVERSGFQSILLRDDGCGINQKELSLAIARHATSKINSLLDLDFITTFGFRGEALASIRAVSRLTLISCTKFNDIAWKIYSEGFINNHFTLQPIAHPQGTTIIVENLFYNIPVRLKFIKNEKSEFLKICEVIKKISLSQFNINFSLKHNKKLIIQYNSINKNFNKINRLKSILNRFEINQLLEIKEKKYDISLFGWMLYFNKLKNIQYCYINNRYIYNDLFINAVRAAYYEITGNKNISFVLYLKIPSNEIDINIHPTKNEIKFKKPNIIYSFIYEAILYNLKKIKNKRLLENIIPKNKNLTIQKYENINPNISLKKINYPIRKLLIVIRKYYGLIFYRNDFLLISFPLAKGIVRKQILINNIEKKIVPECFNTNIKISITSQEYIILLYNKKILSRIGFNMIFKKKYVVFSTVPSFLKKEKIELILSDFFTFLFLKKKILISEIINWFYKNIFIELKNWNYISGTSVLLEIEYYCPLLLINPPLKLLQKINIDTALCILKI